MMMPIKIIYVVLGISILVNKVNSDRNKRTIDVGWEAVHPPFDPNIYEEILDAELCAKQIDYLISNDTLLMITFLETGPRIPRGILQGNLMDLGNYHQCLGINEQLNDMVIDGKYCQIGIGLAEFQTLGSRTEVENAKNAVDIISKNNEINLYRKLRNNLEVINGVQNKGAFRTGADNMGGFQFGVAVCVPKPCSVRQAIENFTELINFEERFCRFKNDKPWAPGVYVTIVIFSLIALLVILSTCYDIWNTVIRKRDAKSLNKICLSFSAYTNGRQLVTYKPVRGALECVDGIRVISIAWIAIGHSFGVSSTHIMNILDFYEWGMSVGSMWLTTANIVVDTFFMLSGLLIVYTTVGKVSSMKLLKKLHLFYLNRILRMFPLLAATILLQVGVLHYIHDGPMWTTVAAETELCRTKWWLTLLYVQNFFRPSCLGHTWYLAIDMQLHILSPLILLWVLSGKRKLAWSALIAGLLVSLTASSIYNFLNNFIGATIRFTLDLEEIGRYTRYYYYNTLTRCSPFFVGMCFGYFIHFWREKNIKLTRILNYILWIVNLSIIWCAFYVSTPMKKEGFDNQAIDNLVNSFMRPTWAFGLGWLILACAEGYGGPINWFLSLRLWKLPSRLSYAIYLLHMPIQFVVTGAVSQLGYFSVSNFVFIYCGEMVIVLIVSFAFVIMVEYPFANIFKMLLGGGIKKTKSELRDDKRNTPKSTCD